MALTAIEFLRRFCCNTCCPRGFVRIRHFGYLASAHRTALLSALARFQLACQPRPNPRIDKSQLATWRCPHCGANMRIGPNSLPRNNSPSDANCPTLPDSNAHPDRSQTCVRTSWHIYVLITKLRPYHLSVSACSSPNYPSSTHAYPSHGTLSRLSFPDSSPPSPRPSLTLSSIAAPTTANAFLQASLSKMPRSNFSLPQHPAPRHFRSRLTTCRTNSCSG